MPTGTITQYFYDVYSYFRLVDETQKLGASVSVVAGIMLITNYSQLMRFPDMCSTEIPRWIRINLASYGDETDSIRIFGLDVVTQLYERLLVDGTTGRHFYMLNQSLAATQVMGIFCYTRGQVFMPTRITEIQARESLHRCSFGHPITHPFQ